MRKVSIVVKSWPGDYEWLSYCLRSIQKFCTGFNDIIVMLPRSHPLTLTAETVVLLDAKEGYMEQQVAKLNADKHTQADYILNFDSDMIFTRPITPDYFFKDEKPIWVMTPWKDIGIKDKRTWFHVMAKCLLECPPAEFMRKGAVIYPSELLTAFRGNIRLLHEMGVDEYVMSQPGHEFSEYNCLGFFAWLYQPRVFHWHDTSVDGVPDWPWKQYWSYGGITDEIRAEMEGILK